MEPESTPAAAATTTTKTPPPLLYGPMRHLFSAAVYSFYNTIEIAHFENFPQSGPTILVFNHGNGLVDAALLMCASSPRVLRFCAKDSLWSLPFWGWFVKNSGAVQVFRPKDHTSEKAAEYNEEMFRKCYEALSNHECLAIAPEGVSRFAPNMAQPLKTGPVRIALRALELYPEQIQAIRICPVGLTYTHREKFRSSVLVDFGKPILVTHEHASMDPFAVARTLTDQVNESLKQLTIHSQDFMTSKLAMTATRMLLPFGTNLSLHRYFSEIRFWVNHLPTHPDTFEALKNYQDLLDEKRVKDERVRRYAFDFELKRPRAHPRVFLLAYRITVFFGLSLLVLPGLTLWSPVWYLIRLRERALLAKGPGWNDSVTEMKMQVGFLFSVLTLAYFRSQSWKALVAIVLHVRVFEEALACGRSLLSHFKFYYLFESTLADLLKKRRIALNLLHSVLDEENHLPRHRPHTEDEEIASVIRVWPWEHWSVFRRKKKDWNETLRLHDHNTMDYFE